MQDPFAWSVPMGRLFGVTIRLHILFPFVALGLILHAAFYKPPEGYVFPEGSWIDVCILFAILGVSTLMHEYGHAFAARAVGGDCKEVLLWPLGGLANVEVPQRPRAHFLTAAAGPAVDLAICAVAVVVLLFIGEGYQVNWNPFPGGYPLRRVDGTVAVGTWAGKEVLLSPYSAVVWWVRIFWVNWFLGLFNLVLVGYPMDSGRMLQSALWPFYGYKQSTLVAVFCGFAMVFLVGLYAVIQKEPLAFGLALFIYMSCQKQWLQLETGGDEGVFGYDFSQGYTSLERDNVQAAPPQPRLSWWRRWLAQREARRIQRELEEREAEEKRMDGLLEKIHREGKQSLTDEEQRFMKRVSDRYRKHK